MENQKKRILLIDDEPSIIKMIAKRLEVEGFEVMTAMDGEEGFQKAQSEKPDLVIVDLMLPKLNGYEVCSLLKKNIQYQKIPIIMFSARTQDRDETLGFECGADAYIRKPVDPKDLIEKVRTLIDRSSAAV